MFLGQAAGGWTRGAGACYDARRSDRQDGKLGRIGVDAGLGLNTVSLALVLLGAVAYAHQRRWVLVTGGALFFAVIAAASVVCWWPISPAVGVVVIAVAAGIPLLLLGLLLLDVTLAPFCLEMTYPALLCWVLSPAGVAANYVALLIA